MQPQGAGHSSQAIKRFSSPVLSMFDLPQVFPLGKNVPTSIPDGNIVFIFRQHLLRFAHHPEQILSNSSWMVGVRMTWAACLKGPQSRIKILLVLKPAPFFNLKKLKAIRNMFKHMQHRENYILDPMYPLFSFNNYQHSIVLLSPILFFEGEWAGIF